MPLSDWLVHAPVVIPMRRGRPGETDVRIYADTHIKIETGWWQFYDFLFMKLNVDNDRLENR